MKKHLLNLAGLHARPGLPAASRGFSRRGFLGAFGLTALVTAPAVSALADIAQSGVRFDHDGHVLRVWLGREVRWLIDPARFAGVARLVFEQTADTVRIVLSGARYPGTDVPADLTCDLRRELGGWSARLRLACGGFETRVPFARWLSGEAVARSTVNLTAPWLDATGQARVAPPSTGEAVFTPDWKLSVTGEGRFSGLGSDFALATLAVALPALGAASRLLEPGAARSTLTLGRGLQHWDLQPALQGSHGRRFNTVENAFGQLVIESEEKAGGSGRRVIEAVARDGALGFEPGTGPEGNRFALPLNQARYAVAFEGDLRQSAVVGRFAPAWMPAGACSLYLGDAASAPAFEASGTGDELDDVVCTPAVLGVAASSDDFLAHSPSTCEAPALLAFTTDTESDKPRQIAQATTARKIAVPANPVTVPQSNKPVPTVPLPTPTPAKPPVVAEIPKDINSKAALGELLVKDGGVLKYALPLTTTIDVLRRDDFLNLSFDFENFSLEGNGNNTRLIPSVAKNPSRVRVTFPPQSIVEEAILDETSEVTRQLSARMAQPSILVFQMPSTQQSVPFDLEELLKALTDWPLVVGGSAAAPKLPAIVAYNGAQTSGSVTGAGITLSSQNPAGFGTTPKPSGAGLNKISEVLPEAPLAGPAEPIVGKGAVTQIEFPYRLILSPNRYARWNHRSEPLKNSGRTELWHTIMGLVPGTDPRLLRMRAIWSPDFPTTGNPDQGPAHSKAPKTANALQPVHRRDLVKLTASASPASLDPILTIDSRLFILSALGAWADLSYSNYSAPTGVGLIGWQHRSTMGRDHYVKVDVLGYLFPFGHEAVLTTISERKIVEGVAALRQHSFITVREPLKLYPADASAGSVELLFPFRSVLINNPRTPNLSADREPIFPGKKPSPKEEIFYIATPYGDLPFSLTATDWAGGTSHFSMPLAFFSKTAVEAPNNAGLVITVNNAAFYAGSGQKINLMPDNIKSDHDSRRTAEFNGQAVALAPSLKPGDSTYSVETLRFIGLPGFANGKAPFHPAVERIEASVPAIQHLLGTTTPLSFAYANIYRSKGFGGGNAGEIVLQLAQGAVYGMTSNATNLTWDVTALPPIAMPFSPERAGGVASPNFSIGGLSRLQGPIGVAAGNAAKVAASLEKFAGNNFDPKEFFSGAKLFGTLDLADLIKQAGAAANAPKLVHIPKVDGSVEITYDFASPLRAFSLPFVDFNTTGGQLTLHNSIKSGTLKNPASTYSQGRLTNFSLTLASVITVGFKELSFTSANGKKPDFSVVLAKGTPTFQGPLALLNSVMSLLDSTGLSDPPFVNVDASGATVGYTLALPDIALGAWALSNLKIASALTLPFTGDPVRMRFAFCERNDPLGVTVSILSGGGFFAMTVSVKGLEEIEASFELGGRLQINLGVASGVISAMAGIYFSLDKSSGTSVVTFSAYLRVGGAVQVLHLITVSIELNLSLSYSPSTHMLSGEASVSVCVHIAFFSKKVSFKVHKDIAGPGSGSQASLDAPPVDQAFAHHESSRWAAYSNAFA